MRRFDKPEDMMIYGREVIGNYADAVKTLAGTMTDLGLTSEQILPVVGRGRFNTLQAQGYIVDGPVATAAARPNMEGLWGAFYFLHKPEQELAMQSLELLRKHGCKLKVTDQSGTHFYPLHKTYFNDYGSNKGDIILNAELESETGGPPLPKGIVLMKKRKWANESGKHFDYVDAQGRSLGEETAARILWGDISSREIKGLGIRSPAARTIMSVGNDDDFTAEGHMVRWLKVLKQDHAIDLMPDFNLKVNAAREALLKRPELLQSFSAAIEMGEMASASFPPQERGYYASSGSVSEQSRRLMGLKGAGESVRQAAKMLELPLPSPPEYPHYLAGKQIIRGVCDQVAAENEQELNWHFRQLVDREAGHGRFEMAIEQSPAFSPDWLESKGNKRASMGFGCESEILPAMHQLIIKGPHANRVAAMLPEATKRNGKEKALGALLEISEYLGQYPGEVFRTGIQAVDNIRLKLRGDQTIVDFPNAVDSIRKAYEAAEPAYAKRMAGSSADVKLGPINDPHYLMQLEHAQVRHFLEMMEHVGCDQQKWLDLYGDCTELVAHPDKLPRGGFFERLRQAEIPRAHIQPRSQLKEKQTPRSL